MKRRIFFALALLSALMAACGGGEPDDLVPEGTAPLTLSSPAFKDGDDIPTAHTCDGADRSPALSWGPPPEGTQSLALVLDDPDAPVGTWVHWVLYDLPPTASSLPEGHLPDETLPDGGTQGENSWGDLGYGGPCPPKSSTHRYFFKLYALDARPGLSAGATKKELLQAIEGHVLALGQLMGRYGR